MWQPTNHSSRRKIANWHKLTQMQIPHLQHKIVDVLVEILDLLVLGGQLLTLSDDDDDDVSAVQILQSLSSFDPKTNHHDIRKPNP